MNKNKKMVMVSIITVLLFFISFMLFFYDIINYFIIFSTITTIMFVYFCYLVFSKKDEKSLYERKLKNILKTYDSILVYSNDRDIIEKENIIFVKRFDDLLTAQEELNKPILYIKEDYSSVFLLQEENELLAYIYKMNDDIESKMEYKLRNIINGSKDADEDIDPNILEQLEKTAIIQLKNNKMYKVSPLKKD